MKPVTFCVFVVLCDSIISWAYTDPPGTMASAEILSMMATFCFPLGKCVTLNADRSFMSGGAAHAVRLPHGMLGVVTVVVVVTVSTTVLVDVGVIAIVVVATSVTTIVMAVVAAVCKGVKR